MKFDKLTKNIRNIGLAYNNSKTDITTNVYAIQDFLQNCIGNSPDEIANNLKLFGIKGKRRNTSDDPIVHLVKKIFNRNIRLMGSHFRDEHGNKWKLNNNIIQYACNLDNGDYKFLVKQQ